MARLAILINSAHTIQEFNEKVLDGADAHEIAKQLINLLKGGLSGSEKDMTIEITSRDNDVVITTSGTGSVQKTVTL